MSFDPSEFGLPSEETSEPLDMQALAQMLAGANPQPQPRTPPPTRVAAQAQRAQAIAQAQARQQENQVPQAEEFDAEVDYRGNLYSYYRLLLTEPLYENDGDKFSEIVENEVRGFIRTRLAELMGKTKPPVAPKAEKQFTDSEATVLRFFAQKMLKAQTNPEPVVEQPVGGGEQIQVSPPVFVATPPPTGTTEPVVQSTIADPPPQPKVRVARRPQKSNHQPQQQAVAKSQPQPQAPAQQKSRGRGVEPPQQADATPDSLPPCLPVPMPTGQMYASVMAQKAMSEANDTSSLAQQVLFKR